MTLEEQLTAVTKERDELLAKMVLMQQLIDFLRHGWLREIQDGTDRVIRMMGR